MSTWSAGKLTEKGSQLQAKVTAGAPLVFTKVKIGDGQETADNLTTLTDLVSPKIELGISSTSIGTDFCKITSILSSSSVTTGFYAREWGLFAQDPVEGEILYMIALDSTPDWVPSGSDISTLAITYTMNVITSGGLNPTVTIDPAGLVTVSMLESALATHNKATDAHADIRALIAKTVSDHNLATNTHADIRKLIAQTVKEHNASDDAHSGIQVDVRNIKDKVDHIWGNELIEKTDDGDMQLSNKETGAPVKLILTEDDEITIGDNECYTANLSYDDNGDVMLGGND